MSTSPWNNFPRHFEDRTHAGRVLAERLQQYANEPNLLVLALPRGGVPVAYEVARTLRAPLDVFQVRKIGVPGHEELAMGAIASGGTRVLNSSVIDSLGISQAQLDQVTQQETTELQRREQAYRGDRPPPDVREKTVILVDDGLATGSTMYAAAQAIRKQGPARLIIAVPTGAAQTCEMLRDIADDVVCAIAPEQFQAVGLWYRDFSQTTDEQVRQLLRQARSPDTRDSATDHGHGIHQG